MSVLKTFGRPTTFFNAENPEHRKLYGEFMNTGSWNHSPVHFAATEEGENIPVIQRQLAEYYLYQEFGKTDVDNSSLVV